eukprot:s3346_g6.t1
MTLWPFQHVVCHSIAYQRLFVAPRCSTAYCLWVLAVITLVVVPLFATFAADNVWVKESFYRVQPVVTFANELYVLIGGNTTESMVGWSTQPQLQVLLPKQVKVPTVRSSTEDHNRDGIADTLQLSLDFPSEGETYRSVLLLAVYNVEIQGKVAEQLSSLVALDTSSPYGSSGLWAHGQLSFRQKLPLYQSPEARSVYVSSPLDVNWRSNWIPDKQPLSLEELLSRYAQSHAALKLAKCWPTASVDKTVKQAELLLEASSFQECEALLLKETTDGSDALRSPYALRLLLHSYRCQGKQSWARKLAEDQLAKPTKAMQHPTGQAMMQLSLAELELADKRQDRAAHLANEALAAFSEMDMPSYEALCLLALAGAASANERHGDAAEFAKDALDRFQQEDDESQSTRGLGRALLALSEAEQALQDFAAADRSTEKSLEVFKFGKDEVWQAFVLQMRAGWSYKQDYIRCRHRDVTSRAKAAEDNPSLAAVSAEAAMHLWQSNGHPLSREAELAEIACSAFLALNQPEDAIKPLRACLYRARMMADRTIEGHMLYVTIRVNQVLGDIEGAIKVADKSWEVFHELGNRRMELAALRTKCDVQLAGYSDEELGNAWLQMFRLRDARDESINAKKALETAIQRFEAAGQRRRAVEAALELAGLSARDYSSAAEMAREVRSLCRKHDDVKGEASALLLLGSVLLQRHDNLEAMKAAEEAFELFRQVGDRFREAEALFLVSQAGRQLCTMSKATVAKHWIYFGAALQAAKDAMALAEHLGDMQLCAHAYVVLAQIQVLSAPLLHDALKNAQEASDLFSHLGHAAGTAWSLELQASASHNLQNHAAAVEALNKAKLVYAQALAGATSVRRCEEFILQLEAGQAAATETKGSIEVKQEAPRLPQPDPMSLQGEDRVMAQLAKILQDLGVEDVHDDDGLMSSGLTSRAAIQLKGEMEQAFAGIHIPSTVAFDYPNIRSLSNWIAGYTWLVREELKSTNETVMFEPLVPPMWDYTPRQSFRIQMTMDVHPQLVYYVPLASEVLKLAWVQVLAFLIPTWVVVEWLKVHFIMQVSGNLCRCFCGNGWQVEAEDDRQFGSVSVGLGAISSLDCPDDLPEVSGMLSYSAEEALFSGCVESCLCDAASALFAMSSPLVAEVRASLVQNRGGKPIREGELWHLSTEDVVRKVHVSLFINGLSVSFETKKVLVPLSPFTLVRNCKFQAASFDVKEFADFKIFKVHLHAANRCYFFGVREEERSSWVSDISTAIRLVTQSLFPPFRIACNPLAAVDGTQKRLLAGYLLHSDSPCLVSALYCELQAHNNGKAMFVLYENENCKVPVKAMALTADSTVAEKLGINCSCFSVDQRDFSSRTLSERKLWLRAISNIKVKLANAAPTPSSEDLEHYRQAVKEQLHQIRTSLQCKIRTDGLLPPSIHNTFQSTVSPFNMDLWAEISGYHHGYVEEEEEEGESVPAERSPAL